VIIIIIIIVYGSILPPFPKNWAAIVGSQFVEQLDITDNSLFFGKKSILFKSGDPLDIFLCKTAILDVKKYLKIK
jgi:hypothetical protein